MSLTSLEQVWEKATGMTPSAFCIDCEEFKSNDQFELFRSGYRDEMCRECVARLSSVEQAEREMGRRRLSRQAYRLRRRTHNRTLVHNRKTLTPCAECKSNDFDVKQKEFDHVRGKKVANISYLVTHASTKKLLEELEKCEVICTGCHRKRTERRARQAQDGLHSVLAIDSPIDDEFHVEPIQHLVITPDPVDEG